MLLGSDRKAIKLRALYFIQTTSLFTPASLTPFLFGLPAYRLGSAPLSVSLATIA